MKIYRVGIGVAIVLSVACMSYFSGGEVGFSYVQSGEKTVVSAATHPVLLVWAAASICLFWVLMRKEIHAERAGYVGLTRRLFSTLIDIYLVVLVGGSSMAFIPLWIEAKRTGHFEWAFARDYSVPTDTYTFFPLSLIAVLLLFLYYAYPLMRGKQTVGSFMLRVKDYPVSSTEGGLTFWQVCKRAFCAGLGLGLWPYTLWKRLDKNGRTWYDRASNWDVALINYK
jgi:hypothetical protein